MEKRIPFIPLERGIDDLIACSNKRITTLLQILKETGAWIARLQGLNELILTLSVERYA
ncbi:hypothetical protein KEJ48_03885 [Candidatus Bathyarchaeota archaeon]|nr:hypothetical protein [Candidatus Bathyarchaeota archaeon]